MEVNVVNREVIKKNMKIQSEKQWNAEADADGKRLRDIKKSTHCSFFIRHDSKPPVCYGAHAKSHDGRPQWPVCLKLKRACPHHHHPGPASTSIPIRRCCFNKMSFVGPTASRVSLLFTSS